MTEEGDDVPARMGRGPKLSAVWLVPIAGFVIGLWMVYFHWTSQGPLVEITFVSAEGIEAGKTKVKSKNVEIGEVLDLRLSEDAERVVLSVRFEKHDAHLLREDSSFWIVRPRIGKGGVSGLSTILSGAYIELSPGVAEDTADRFEGLETPPVTPIGTPGLHVTLDSAGDRALNAGDPISFHGIEVGRIEYVHFNGQERRTYYNAFIAAPYDRLITSNTRFWFTSGIGISLSADGVRFEMGSLASIVSGGVSFDVPDGQPLGERVTERAFFTIYARETAIYEEQFEHSLTYITLFDDSIRGLRPGAPVEYRGVKVGQVVRTDIEYEEISNLLDPASKIPVLIEIVPARLGFADSEMILNDVENQIDNLIAGGLRAGLATGNLLSGRKYVELEYRQQATGNVSSFATYTVIPTVESQVGQLLANAASTLDMINDLPLDRTIESVRNAMDEFASTVAELEAILADPESREVTATLNAALESFQQLAVDFSEGSATHQDLQQSFTSLERTLAELAPVLRNLHRRPNSLIFGGNDKEDREPEGVRQ